MTHMEYEAAIDRGDTAPEDLPRLLQALWIERQGDWERAHRITQDEAGGDAAWVHAYLHRKEGDLANARYWYRRAGRPEAIGDLDAEWGQIFACLLRSAT